MNTQEDNNSLINRLKQLFSSINFDSYPSFIDDLFSLIKSLQKSREQEFVFLLVGRTGVGKSSTINSLFGEEVAPEGKYDPTTMAVTSYKHEINNIKFKIIDTPGLCDDLPEKGNDQKYVELMRNKVKQIDSLCFVTRLDDSRVTSDEMRGIEIISEAFTVNVWNYAVIIFTRADKVDDYLVDLKERTNRIRKAIAKHTGDQIANSIPVIAVDNKSKTLTTPDGKRWLEELYTQVFKRMSDRGAIPFFLATSLRISKNKTSESKKTQEPKREEKQQKNVQVHKEVRDSDKSDFNFNERQTEEIRSKLFSTIPFLEKVGGFIGSMCGGSLGNKIGATIGGVVGYGIDLIFSLFF